MSSWSDTPWPTYGSGEARADVVAYGGYLGVPRVTEDHIHCGGKFDGRPSIEA